jgi:DMSO/TMAO reductase YedYZ molybdopterin-dependent catalytic subunit
LFLNSFWVKKGLRERLLSYYFEEGLILEGNLMEKRFFQILLIVFIFSLICSSSAIVLYPEFSTASNVHVTNSSKWRLIIDGSVDHPLNLTLDELAEMPKSTVNADLYCYGYFVTGGNWSGVRLGLLLDRTYESHYVYIKNVEFYAEDGYKIVLSISTAMQENVIVAYEKDNEPLSETLRLVIPDANGDQWIAMINHIRIVSVEEAEGYGTINLPFDEYAQYVILSTAVVTALVACFIIVRKWKKPAFSSFA